MRRAPTTTDNAQPAASAQPVRQAQQASGPELAPIDALQQRRVLKLAAPLACQQPEDAAGRCLALSLELALRVRSALGLQLGLVRWQVVGDPDYVEHWAVEMSPGTLVDPTRVQVDGHTGLRASLSDYPAHCLRPQRYPAALLLPAFEAVRHLPGERLPARFLAGCGRRILAHDLQQAWRQRSPAQALHAAAQAWRFAWVCLLKAGTRWLERRASQLLGRLHDQPDVPSRNSGLAEADTAAAPPALRLAATVTAAMLVASAGPQPAPPAHRPQLQGRPVQSQRT